MAKHHAEFEVDSTRIRMEPYLVKDKDSDIVGTYSRTNDKGETAILHKGGMYAEFKGLSEKNAEFVRRSKLYPHTTLWYTAQEMIINGSGFYETAKAVFRNEEDLRNKTYGKVILFTKEFLFPDKDEKMSPFLRKGNHIVCRLFEDKITIKINDREPEEISEFIAKEKKEGFKGPSKEYTKLNKETLLIAKDTLKKYKDELANNISMIDNINVDEALSLVRDWSQPEVRDDLVALKGVKMGEIRGVVPKPGKGLFDAASFEIGNTRIWQAGIRGEDIRDGCLGWQIADLNDGVFENHRGFSSDLISSFNFVLEEQGKFITNTTSLDEIKQMAASEDVTLAQKI